MTRHISKNHSPCLRNLKKNSLVKSELKKLKKSNVIVTYFFKSRYQTNRRVIPMDAIVISCSLSSRKSKQNIYQYERIQELGYAKFLVRSENQLRSRSHSVKKVALNC